MDRGGKGGGGGGVGGGGLNEGWLARLMIPMRNINVQFFYCLM